MKLKTKGPFLSICLVIAVSLIGVQTVYANPNIVYDTPSYDWAQAGGGPGSTTDYDWDDGYVYAHSNGNYAFALMGATGTSSESHTYIYIRITVSSPSKSGSPQLWVKLYDRDASQTVFDQKKAWPSSSGETWFYGWVNIVDGHEYLCWAGPYSDNYDTAQGYITRIWVYGNIM